MRAKIKQSLQGKTRGYLIAVIESPKSLRKSGLYALYVTLLLRAIWGLSVPVVPLSDGFAYDVLAQNIAMGDGYGWKPGEPTAYWAVGTSAAYALLYAVFGYHFLPIVILNVLVGVAIVALAMSLARRWLGEMQSILTGWILAIWPLLIEYTTVLASELLFNFCVLLALWLASMPHWKALPRSLATSVVLAAACYVRPVALLIAPLVFLREAFFERQPARVITTSIIASIMMIILILPWSFRNQHVLNHFVLISTNAGVNLWMGNNPNTTGGYMKPPKLNIINEAELDRELNQQAWFYICQNPLAFGTRTIKKMFILHDRESIGVAWNEQGLQKQFGHNIMLPLKLISSGYWYCILISACIGVFFLLRYRSWLEVFALPPLVFWLYFTVIHGITVTGDRYHMPSIPFVAMLAAYGIDAMFHAMIKYRQKIADSAS